MTLPTEVVFDGVNCEFLGTFLFRNPTVELLRDRAQFSSNGAVPDANVVLAGEHSFVEAVISENVVNATIPCRLRTGVGPGTFTFVSIEQIGNSDPPVFQLAMGIPENEHAAHQMLEAVEGMSIYRDVLDSGFHHGVDVRIAVESAAVDSYGGVLAQARLYGIQDLIRFLRVGLRASNKNTLPHGLG